MRDLAFKYKLKLLIFTVLKWREAHMICSEIHAKPKWEKMIFNEDNLKSGEVEHPHF